MIIQTVRSYLYREKTLSLIPKESTIIIMTNFQKSVSGILSLLWGFPQNILGMIYLLWCILDNQIIIKVNNLWTDNAAFIYIINNQKGSITLGNFVFVSSLHYNMYDVIKHELGHVKQSYITGPLYLVIIGIPSIVHAALRRIFPALKKTDYYDFYTEKWANKLMNLI